MKEAKLEVFSYVLAELLKRNTELHGKHLRKRRNFATWPGETRKIIINELTKCPLNGNLKAFSGLLWGKLRLENITTRQIYGLLLQWALLLTEKGLLSFYTEDYEALIEELKFTIEAGAEGTVKDIPPEEIIAEWEFMKGYLITIQNMCEEWNND